MVHVLSLIDDTMSAHLRRQLWVRALEGPYLSLLCMKSCAAIRNQMTFEVVTVSVAGVSLHSGFSLRDFLEKRVERGKKICT